MYTLDPDTYSHIVQLLPIDSINDLRLTASSNSQQLSALRNTDNFWKLRLEKFLDIQITLNPAPQTWHQVYTKITTGDLNLSQKLITFAQAGDFLVVRLLVEAGADVTSDNNVALRAASANGHLQVVKVLLEAGANVTANDNLALRQASQNGRLKVVQVLLAAGADVTADNNFALIHASAEGHAQVVQLLLNTKADVTAGINSALREASSHGHSKVVQLLIQAGATL